MTTPPDDAVVAVLKRLDELAEQKPELSEAVAYYRLALPAQLRAAERFQPYNMTREAAQRKLAQGTSLLIREETLMNAEGARMLFQELCHALQVSGPPARSRAARKIQRAVQADQLDPNLLLGFLVERKGERIASLARQKKLDEQIIQSLTASTLGTALRAWARGIETGVDYSAWQRGVCPVCSSAAAFAELQGTEGSRHLRCTICGADWPYARLRCAHCGNEDHRTLGTLSVEGEEKTHYASTCMVCHHYTKTFITFAPTPTEMLVVEDLATLYLDTLAAKEGFVSLGAP